MTQTELAEYLGTDQSTVSKWIARGMPREPEAAKAWVMFNVRSRTKRKIRTATGLPPGWM
jgi:hypothetical protein